MVAMDSIGRYRLVRRIGAGSFATVWLGNDDDLDVPVAVKVLADNWASNDDVRNRFLAEARIMRRIHDRRLVQVYDIGTLDDGRPYFVMDYIDGGSMNDLRKQGIHPVRALRLCAEACRALDVLHAHDIIHRDVTPGNLLLSKIRQRRDPGADRRPRCRKVHAGCGWRHHDCRHTLLHGTRAGDGCSAAGQAGRYLLADRGDVRDVDRPSPVPGTQHCRHTRARPVAGSGADRRTARRTINTRWSDALGAGCRPEPPPADRPAPGGRAGDDRGPDGGSRYLKAG